MNARAVRNNKPSPNFFLIYHQSHYQTKQVKLRECPRDHPDRLHTHAQSAQQHFTLPYESLQFNSTAEVVWEQLI